MAINFTPVQYVDGETVIGAANLNAIQAALGTLDTNKVDKEEGKGLSANDYTSTDKQKVDRLQNVANLTYEVVSS